jgi:hypothetical protein
MSVDVNSPSLSIHGRPVSILKTSRDFDSDVATSTGLNEGSNSKIGQLVKGNRTSVKLGNSRNGRFTKSDDFDRQMQKKRSVSFGEDEIVEVAESSSEPEVTIDRAKIKKSPQKQVPKEEPREKLELSVSKALSPPSSPSSSDSDSDDGSSVRKREPPRKAPAVSRAEALKKAAEAAKAAAGRALDSGSDSDDSSGSSGSGSDAGSYDSSVTSGSSSDDY